MSMNVKFIQSRISSLYCIHVIQQLTKHGILKAQVIGNSQNSYIVEHTRDVAKKYNLDAKLEPVIVKKNICTNPLLCACFCNTIYTEYYDNKSKIVLLKIEKILPH